MENKQIVDDVQIRGCGHYWNGTCHAYTDNTGKFLLCVNNPHCYYKQLALKKQECEELRKQLERKEENYQKLLSKSNKYIHNLVDENVQDISNLARQLEQFKADNEKLKKQVCGLRPELKHLINEICHKYDIEAKTYHEKIVEIIHSLDDYKQALDNIEEILKQGIKIHDDIIVSKQILQKARGRKW